MTGEYQWIHVLNTWERTHCHGKTVADVKTTGDLFEVDERQAVLEKNHDNNFYLESFVPYKASDVRIDFVAKWNEFEAETSSIRGSTGIPLSYLLRQTIIPKDEADDDEDEYATIDAQMIQRAQIIKTAYITMTPDDLEEAGPTKKTASAKLDNMRLYDLMKKKFCNTTMWAHTKTCARDCDGCRAMIAMHVNSLLEG